MKKEDRIDDNAGAKAWLLKVGQGINAAVGQYEVIHILDKPELISIPQAPLHCNQVVLWNNRIIPIIDLSAWFAGHFEAEIASMSIVAIVVYYSPEGEYCYGGLKLSSIPVLNQVKDDQFCDLPGNSVKWKRISLSSFTAPSDGVVPVLDLPSIFSTNFS